jgi:ubiquinone/menaquinone biosynthesis C-methylase UbiE
MSNSISGKLPYIDQVLADLPDVDDEQRKVLSRHLHWGYWENPATAAYTLDSLAMAQEQLSQQVADAGQIQSGQRVLDCGCGFGGTIATLNDRLHDMDMVGLNIDPRQLEIARSNFQPQHGNRAEFVEGDACELPFDDNSFDRVLALECIFHFPSRQRFFQEVKRVLRPGGTLSLCDFVPRQIALVLDKVLKPIIQSKVGENFGAVDYSYSIQKYRDLARETGFLPLVERDITANTLPTYPVSVQVWNQNGSTYHSQSSAVVSDRFSRLGLIRYMILAYRQVPSSSEN